MENKGYLVFFDHEYIPANCDNCELFETLQEALEFAGELEKGYAYKIVEY
jgi:hypothetical protein